MLTINRITEVFEVSRFLQGFPDRCSSPVEAVKASQVTNVPSYGQNERFAGDVTGDNCLASKPQLAGESPGGGWDGSVDLGWLFLTTAGVRLLGSLAAAGTMQLAKGSTRLRRVVFGVPPKTSSLHSLPTKRGEERWWNKVMAGTATTARGTRALPFQRHRSG